MSDRDRDWLLARERGDDVSHVPAQIRARYADLAQLIAELPGTSPPPGWKRGVLDRLDPPASPVAAATAPRRRGWAIAGALSAAVIIVIVIVALAPGRPRRAGPDGGAPEVVATAAIERAGQPHRGAQAAVGDTWIVEVEARRPVELRVYGDAGEPLARCGDEAGDGCTATTLADRRRYVLRVRLAARGDVRAIAFVGGALPAAEGLEPDLAAARQLGFDAHHVAVVPVL